MQLSGGTCDKLFRPPERLNTAIWRYMWFVYRLAGGTATDILVAENAGRG